MCLKFLKFTTDCFIRNVFSLLSWKNFPVWVVANVPAVPAVVVVAELSFIWLTAEIPVAILTVVA